MENEYVIVIKDYILTFTSILYEAMPFIVLGAIISGILEELVPQQFFARVVPKNRFLAIAMSALPGGKAWYAHQLRVSTTTDLTPDEIHQLGLSEVARIRKEMDELIDATGFAGRFADF